MHGRACRVARSALLAVSVLALSVEPHAADQQPRAERLTARASGDIGEEHGFTSAVEIVFWRFYTDDEVDALVKALTEKGVNEFRAVMQGKPPCGQFSEYRRKPDLRQEAYPLAVAYERPDRPNRRHIVVITLNGESLFTYIDLWVDMKGKGKGRLVDEASAVYNRKTGRIDFLDWSWPVKLTRVRIAPVN